MKHSTKVIIANWKSHKTDSEIKHWLTNFEATVPSLTASSLIVAIAPPMSSLATVSAWVAQQDSPHVTLAIQDLSPYPAGSYTGAVCTRNIEGMGVKYAIVGHSERRAHFHETNQEVALKVVQALDDGITPIVCVSAETLIPQVKAIDSSLRSKCLFAFEPIDHIGTGIADDLTHILEQRSIIEPLVKDLNFLYGGSVDAHSDTALLSAEQIDGFLVGTASLDSADFSDLLTAIIQPQGTQS